MCACCQIENAKNTAKIPNISNCVKLNVCLYVHCVIAWTTFEQHYDSKGKQISLK